MIRDARIHLIQPGRWWEHDSQERDRRQKWVERQRRKGNLDATLADAPERRPQAPSIPPCPTCGLAGMNFDLRRDPSAPRGLARYCVPCESAVQNGLDARRAAAPSRGTGTCIDCGRTTYPGKRCRGRCKTCMQRIYARAKGTTR